MVEPEGVSLTVEESVALEADLTVMFRAAWIKLDLRTELDVVGIAAVIAKTLTEHKISCNVVAGAYHDHFFVAHEHGDAALSAMLRTTTRGAGRVNLSRFATFT
jgi:uncharacterized protein